MTTKLQVMGQWVTRYVLTYLKEHRQKNAEKVLIKIEGINEVFYAPILDGLVGAKEEISAYYTPLIRATKSIHGFDQYVLSGDEHKNGVWLRNNVEKREALILLLNETTAEAQSLKDIVSIDETQLLSATGLHALDAALRENKWLETHQVDELITLISAYQHKDELDLQLSMLLSFIEQVIKDAKNSKEIFINVLGNALVHFRLFKDPDLSLGSKDQLRKRLKNNFLMSHLRRNMVTDLDANKLHETIDKFIGYEEKNGYPSDIWDSFGKDKTKLIEKTTEFIERKNMNLLSLLTFEQAGRLFKFKASNRIQDRLMNVRERLLDAYDEQIETVATMEEKSELIREKQEAEARFDHGMAAVIMSTDLEAMVNFQEEFEEVLKDEKMYKPVTSIINKKENPSEYTDLLEAVLSEVIVMVEGLEDNEFIGNLSFELSIGDKVELSQEQADFFRFHLNFLSFLSENLIYDDDIRVIEDAEKELPKLPLTLKLKRNDVELNTAKFNLAIGHLFEENSFTRFFGQVIEGSLGYFDVNKGNWKTCSLDKSLEEIQHNAKISENESVHNAVQSFKSFNESYTRHLAEILKENGKISKSMLDDIVSEVESYLEHVNGDVDSVRRVYSLVNQMGTINYSDSNTTNGRIVEKKVLSVFNPIRFVAYAHRVIQLGKHVFELTDTAKGHNTFAYIENSKHYKAFAKASYDNLAPAYTLSTNEVFLFEQEELYGQGVYMENGEFESVASQITTFSNEVVKVTSDYVKVYPYAADCLDLLFLYVTNLEFVKKSITQILQKDDIRKLNVTIHSPKHAAMIYDEINQWISSNEDYTNPIDMFSEFPRLEINVLPFSDAEQLMEQLRVMMLDFDLAIFVDYFGQSENLKMPSKFILEPYRDCELDDPDWLVYSEREFRSEKEGTRLLNYVSNRQPRLMRNYYNMLAIVKDGIVIDQDKINLLRGELSVTKTEANKLYKFAHENFNWVMTYDKFMDPSFMKQVADGSNIIRYHVNRSGKDEIKVLVSSSVRRGDETNYYRDRLTSRLKGQLEVRALDTNKVEEAIKTVKGLSGGLMLRSLGPGRFVNEFLSVYLTVTRENQEEAQADVVTLWDTCDELSWFRTKNKRPDLLKTMIRYDYNQRKYLITFKLIELKLIKHDNYQTEVADAKHQVLSGERTLQKFFKRFESSLERKLHLNTFKLYLEDKRTYSENELAILQHLKERSDVDIDFNFEKEVYAYVHDQDVAFNQPQVEANVYREFDQTEDITVYTFNRSYVLSRLNVSEEDANIQVENDSVTDVEVEQMTKKEEEVTISPVVTVQDESVETTSVTEPITQTPSSTSMETHANDTGVEHESVEFPEYVLGRFEGLEETEHTEKLESLGKQYSGTVQNKLRLNGIQFSVEDVLVGASVIRIIGRIPPNETVKSVVSRDKDMVLWLNIDSPPTIFSNRYGINIDIKRDDPETIEFERFMYYARRQIDQKHLAEKFIVPIGLDPLDEVMYIDFNGTEPHMLVAGSTGSGKSVSLNAIVLSMMCLYRPEDLQFVFIDPKQVEFSIFDSVRHTRKVSTDIDEAADYLDSLVDEMEKRYELMKHEFVKNLMEYNDLMKEEGKPDSKLPRIVIVFDEFADFMMRDKDFARRIETAISRIGQKGRAAGIHMIVCTQSPKAEIINTTIRNNLLARLCLKVTDSVASKVVLDETGGENLAGKGDYLLKIGSNPLRGKSPYLAPPSLRKLMKYFRK